MRPPLSWLLRLYPRAWRERYGHEFEALVDDTGHPWRHTTDIFLEAMKLRLAAQNWRVIGSFGLVGFLVASTIAWRMTPRYVSRAVVRAAVPSGTSPVVSWQGIYRLANEVLSNASLSQVVENPNLNLYQQQRREIPMTEVVRAMRQHDLRVIVEERPKINTRSFSIEFFASDPAIARSTVERLVTRFINENQRAGGSQVPLSLELVDVPSLPVDPVSPSRLRIVLIGVLLGLTVGKLGMWRPGRRRPPVRTSFTFAGILTLPGILITIGVFPIPYTSDATLEFPTPAARDAALNRQASLKAGLLESVRGDGFWYRTDIHPLGKTQARFSVRYSNRFKAQAMGQALASRIPEAQVYEPPLLPSEAPTRVYGPRIVIAGIALFLFTGLLLLLNRRQRLTPQTV